MIAKKRSIILYWILLLVPTVIVAGAAFRLLGYERERMERQAVSSAQDRARTIAENLQIAVDTVEENLTEALRAIPPDRLVDTLLAWEAENPLVRNVFVWRPKAGLQYPPIGKAGTAEERRFAARYGGLFSGRIPWRSSDGEATARQPEEPSVSSREKDIGQTDAASQQQGLVQSMRQFRVGRRELEALTQAGRPEGQVNAPLNETASAKIGGWIPWFDENRLHLLGWVQRPSDGLVYGVELELMTLLSRLVTNFPPSEGEGTVYALLDGEERVLHRTGLAELRPGAKPDVALSLAPQLPHWRVAVYFVDSGPAAQASRAFVIFGGLLLAIFVAAILLGGGLLAWQAHRNMIDAMQKTSFVSNVSHELRTPLTSIRMYAELLSEGRVTDHDKTKRYLQTIAAESQRLTRLVNNVLDFGRLEQGRMKYHLGEVELTEFLRDFIESQRFRLIDAGLAVHAEISQEAISATVDRDALEQVLVNVVDNAVKYAAEGGELVFSLAKTPTHLELRIMDRGPGIPVEHRSRIFDTFHRVDDSLTTRQPGAGLGLSIAQRMVRDLGGDLVYEPREGGGSSFVVRLPLSEAFGEHREQEGER